MVLCLIVVILMLKNSVQNLAGNSRKKVDIFLTKSAFKKQKSSAEKWLRTGGSPLGYIFDAFFRILLNAFYPLKRLCSKSIHASKLSVLCILQKKRLSLGATQYVPVQYDKLSLCPFVA